MGLRCPRFAPRAAALSTRPVENPVRSPVWQLRSGFAGGHLLDSGQEMARGRGVSLLLERVVGGLTVQARQVLGVDPAQLLA